MGALPTWVGAYCTAGKFPLLFPWDAFAFCGILNLTLESTTCENLSHSWICSLIFSCRSREGKRKTVWIILLGWTPVGVIKLSLIIHWFYYGVVERSKPTPGVKERKRHLFGKRIM